MGKSIQEWIQEGEQLHANAVAELADVEAQIAELEQRRAAKLAEVNQIAGIIGKPTSEPVRKTVTPAADDHFAATPHPSSATIARALAGKGLGR